MADTQPRPRPAVRLNAWGPRGSFMTGMVIGLLVGLGVALMVALYITKAPIPFVNKVPQRTAEQDAAEAERNRQWDPNAPLAGKNPARPAPPPAPPAAVASAALAAAASAPAPAASAAKPATAARATKDPAAILAGQADGTAPARPAGREVPLTAGAAGAAPATPASGVQVQFYVQVGAYSTPEDAEAQRAKVAMTGLSAKVLSREQAGRTVYRVRTGPYDNRSAAEDVQDKLAKVGLEANLVRVER